jgi:OmpA-OmpF porin, OOP family
MRTMRSLLLPFLAGLAGASVLAAPGPAWCQTQEFSVQRFEPAPGPDNFLGVETLPMEGKWSWSAGLFFNYSYDPFVVQSCTTTATTCTPTGPSTHVVRDMLTWDLLASVSPTPWLQLGLRFPLSYVIGDGLDLSTGGPLSTPLHAFGAGDPDIEAKFRILGKPGAPLVLGIAADVSFPAHAITSSNFSTTNFIGDSSPVTGDLRAILEGRVGAFRYGGNLRAVIREDVTIAAPGATGPELASGSELRWGAAAGYQVTPIVEVMLEAFGGTGFRALPGSNSLEIDGAVRIKPHESPIAITLGGGAGVLYGVGVPAARAFAGLLYAPGAQQKPSEPVPAETVCPDIPDPVPGIKDARGCPVEAPRPPPDRDHDGIPDAIDKCPDAGGDVIRDLESPYYGCPDRDHDGVPDHLDKCPDVPAPHDDTWDGSGCPHERKGPVVAEITETAIALHDRVEFATAKDKIEGAKSFAVLDAVLAILSSHPEVLLVEVQGHTDSAGLAAANRKLSQKRAEAVVNYLVSKGVDAARLVPKGYGPDKPLADNKTAKGRQTNRRVELLILNKKKAPAPSPPPSPTPPPAAAPPPSPTPPASPTPAP